jgi:hypothetical protein
VPAQNLATDRVILETAPGAPYNPDHFVDPAGYSAVERLEKDISTNSRARRTTSSSRCLHYQTIP